MPPFACSAKTTWSFLKSVGFSQASTPLANLTIVRPTSSTLRVAVIAAGSGLRSIELARRRRVVPRRDRRGFRRGERRLQLVFGRHLDVGLLRRRGEDDPAVVGEERLAERGDFRRRYPGSNCCTSLYSYSMPGLGSSSRK